MTEERRALRRGSRDGETVVVLVTSRDYPAAPEEVWAALATPERLSRWFLPFEGDLQQGGRFQFKGNAGGTILDCEPPRRVEATWEFAGQLSWVEVVVEPTPDGARFTLTHSAPTSGASGEHWATYGPAAVGIGWDLGLIGLGLHLSAPDAPRPPDFEAAYMASDEGRATVRASGAAWADAAIALGEPEDAARAAADRTIAFYLGEG